MKFIIGFVFVMAFLAETQAQVSSTSGLVLGYDYEAQYENENPFVFPCSAYMGVVFCSGKELVFEDTGCEKTLRFQKNSGLKQVAVSCQLSSGEEFEIAKTSVNAELLEDETQDGFGYFQLQFNPRVSVQSKQLVPNGLIQKLIVIQ